MAANVWTQKRITNDTTELPDGTVLRVVKLPTVKGIKAGDRDALFAFEREHLGTVKAVIRMNKRADGQSVPVPARLAGVAIPADLERFYA